MKLSLDPAASTPRHITAESEALADWYDARPTIRRLWAVKGAESLSVIVTLEPTVDNSDTYPAWFACSQGWAREIQSLPGGEVRLGMVDEPPLGGIEVDI